VHLDATCDGVTVRVEVRPNGPGYTLVLDGRRVEVDAAWTGPRVASLLVEGRSYDLTLERTKEGYRAHSRDGARDVTLRDARDGERPAERRASGPHRLVAPMPGRVVRVLVAPEAEVSAGEGLVVVEAMKMENELRAPRAGRVASVEVREGQAVDTGALLLVLA
jgi:biotin carboxyl carrier protein